MTELHNGNTSLLELPGRSVFVHVATISVIRDSESETKTLPRSFIELSLSRGLESKS